MDFETAGLGRCKVLFTHLSKSKHELYLLFRLGVLFDVNILGLVVVLRLVPHKRAAGDRMERKRRTCDVSTPDGDEVTLCRSDSTYGGGRPGWGALGRCLKVI
jgi:hypothetical protein